MKLSVNKPKSSGLWARNYATIQLVFISKFAFGPEKLPDLSRNGPLIRNQRLPNDMSDDLTTDRRPKEGTYYW